MYGLLWQPAHQALPKLQAALPQLRAQADQMQSLAGQVQSLRQKAQLAVLDSDALKIVVEKSAQAANLPLAGRAGRTEQRAHQRRKHRRLRAGCNGNSTGTEPAHSRGERDAGGVARIGHGQGAGHTDQRGGSVTLRRVLLALVFGSVFIIGLIAFAPASLMGYALERASGGTLSLVQTQGSVWHGSGVALLRQNSRYQTLGSYRWQLQVFSASVQVQAGEAAPMTVRYVPFAGRINVDNLHISLPASIIG